MNLANITHESLTEQLDKEVPEVFVIIAKHRAAGVDVESIADIIGCDVGDVSEVESDPLYNEVRQIIGVSIATTQADQSIMLDALEAVSVKKLLDIAPMMRDPEMLLRVAATANKMTRRTAAPEQGILDPSQAGRKVAVQLTRRMVEQVTQAGHVKVVQEDKQLSIHDGSMTNPSFDEVDSILGLSAPKDTTKRVQQTGGLSFEELDRKMQES